MEIGEKEIEIKDVDATIKCSKKIIDHIRKIEENNSSSKNKLPQEQIRLSEQEKCFRTTLVREGLFTLCVMGLGNHICESYDRIKDEEKKFGRKLTDNEIYQIIIDMVRKYKIVSDSKEDKR